MLDTTVYEDNYTANGGVLTIKTQIKRESPTSTRAWQSTLVYRQREECYISIGVHGLMHPNYEEKQLC